VCTAGSVEVTEFMRVERFSHIMHIVSSVEGDVVPGATAIDVFRATFPAGTLSGAPKPRALEIIDELEPAQRGVYGGVIGYFGFSGDADLAIAIRTATIMDGVARVQAGGGLVADSVPESEFQESVNKAAAPLRAVAVANAMRRVTGGRAE
jgi:anthranilate synthase component 1